MNNITPISSVSFSGLAVYGTVSGKNVKKLGDFASRVENINFINDLEKYFEVDAVLDNEITKMSFVHKKFGDLSGRFGCSSYPLENVFRDVTEVIKDIKSAIKRAEKNSDKCAVEKRGC